MNVHIRPEAPGDQASIFALTEAAFRGRPYAGGDEQVVVDRLRRAGALVLSLVAVDGDVVVGHAAFSPADADDGSSPWFALGPVSVAPAEQGRGVGAALIRQGLEEIEARGALGCILTGDPGYYRRFGFEPAPDSAPPDEPPEYFMLKRFTPGSPGPRFRFHWAFYGDPPPR